MVVLQAVVVPDLTELTEWNPDAEFRFVGLMNKEELVGLDKNLSILQGEWQHPLQRELVKKFS